jgi:sterol desaturase/sphingolipid hydroxylase (fatty acid hydroxylase superfamily)
MSEHFLRNWSSIYMTMAFSLLALLMLLESSRPRNRLRYALRRRWLANLCVLLIDHAMLRLLLPVGATLVAADSTRGLFQSLPVPGALAFVVTWLALDLSLYALHRLVHRVPLLWRVHRLHHADPDVDVTTGWRFHPLDALLQGATMFAVVTVLGSSPMSVATYLMAMAAVSMLSHANILLPRRMDGLLRWLVITPDMHRIHHSRLAGDYNANFCVGLSLWDRLLGTYRAVPVNGYEAMSFGIEGRDPERAARILEMLADPLFPVGRTSGRFADSGLGAVQALGERQRELGAVQGEGTGDRA